VGSRVVSRAYGSIPRSHLLHNDGRGRFTDVTADIAPALAEAGMVTSAAWVDYDHDGALDLVVVGEWMPVRVFHQERGHFVDRTNAAGLSGTEGWWNSVTVTDVNGDGRPDLVLGNLGLNSYLRASPANSVTLYVYDFFHTGTLKQVLTFATGGARYPLASRDELLKLMPSLASKYPTYQSFAGRTVEEILPAVELRQAKVLEARVFASSIALNSGNGAFELRSLPVEAQFSPVYATVARDFDGDGRVDLLLAGNLYGVPPMLGRFDASEGVLLHGTGNGGFTALDPAASGVILAGQVRHMQPLRVHGSDVVAVARNNDTLRMFRLGPAR